MTVYTQKSPEGTAHRRFQEAVRIMRASGVRWAFNVYSCCRSCADVEDRWKDKKDFHVDSSPYGWTFAGQGHRLCWVDGSPAEMKYDKSYGKSVKTPVTSDYRLYIYHDNGAGEAIANAFRIMGFDVEWNGSAVKAVEVFIPHA